MCLGGLQRDLLFLEVVSCARHTLAIYACNRVSGPAYLFSDSPQPSSNSLFYLLLLLLQTEELSFRFSSSANRPGRLCGPPILLFIGYRRSFLGFKAARAWRCPHSSSAEIRNDWRCTSSYAYAFKTCARQLYLSFLIFF